MYLNLLVAAVTRVPRVAALRSQEAAPENSARRASVAESSGGWTAGGGRRPGKITCGLGLLRLYPSLSTNLFINIDVFMFPSVSVPTPISFILSSVCVSCS